MRKLIVDEWMTLDGVAQAPMESNEDTSGDFRYGGWHMPYADDAFQKWVVRNLEEAGGFIFGRRTYQAFAGHWPQAAKEEQAMADLLNQKPKYVASRTLSEPLEWQNSTLLHGDLKHSVAALKGEAGGDLHVIGSTNFVQSLFKENLVDELRVIIDPVTVGGGKRIFPEDGALRAMRLVQSEVTSAGGFIATYATDGG
jgi:dihydrofolate reductase